MAASKKPETESELLCSLSGKPKYAAAQALAEGKSVAQARKIAEALKKEYEK